MVIITKKLTIILFCSVLVMYSIVCITIQMYDLNLVEKKKSNFIRHFYEFDNVKIHHDEPPNFNTFIL